MNQRIVKIVKILTLSLSVLMFLASLTQNAYYLGEHEESLGSFGLIAFLLGWFGVFGAGVSWLANPFLIISWGMLIFGNLKKSLILSALALLFSLSFMLFDDIIANEGGGHMDITSYDIGYYLWLSSCGINLLGNFILYKNYKNSH